MSRDLAGEIGGLHEADSGARHRLGGGDETLGKGAVLLVEGRQRRGATLRER